MTDTGQPGLTDDERRVRRLRTAAHIGVAIQVLIYISLYVYIGWHSNPKGDGMEWAAIVPATFVLGLGVVPALALCLINWMLRLAVVLTVIGVAMNLALFAEIVREFAQSAGH
jgi:hypothetical protein